MGHRSIITFTFWKVRERVGVGEEGTNLPDLGESGGAAQGASDGVGATTRSSKKLSKNPFSL